MGAPDGRRAAKQAGDASKPRPTRASPQAAAGGSPASGGPTEGGRRVAEAGAGPACARWGSGRGRGGGGCGATGARGRVKFGALTGTCHAGASARPSLRVAITPRFVARGQGRLVVAGPVCLHISRYQGPSRPQLGMTGAWQWALQRPLKIPRHPQGIQPRPVVIRYSCINVEAPAAVQCERGPVGGGDVQGGAAHAPPGHRGVDGCLQRGSSEVDGAVGRLGRRRWPQLWVACRVRLPNR